MDIFTVGLTGVAVFILVQPGSSIRGPIENKVHDMQFARFVTRNWASLVASSVPIADANDAPDVIEFADYECPFCRSMSPAVDSAIKSGVKISYIHFPLPIHAHARRASLLAICAQDAGAFRQVHEYLMSADAWQKDTAWSRIPELAALMNQSDFAKCMSSASTANKLDKQIALGRALKLTGTPTLVSRSKHLSRATSAGELAELAR